MNRTGSGFKGSALEGSNCLYVLLFLLSVFCCLTKNARFSVFLLLLKLCYRLHLQKGLKQDKCINIKKLSKQIF